MTDSHRRARLFEDATLPSEVIMHALADLSSCEADPAYEVNMGTWHEPDFISRNTCFVCVAGAVIAKSYHTNPRTPKNPDDFSEQVKEKFFALECFRRGDIPPGLLWLGRVDWDRDSLQKHIGCWISEPEGHPPLYDKDPKGFITYMLTLAHALQKQGL